MGATSCVFVDVAQGVVLSRNPRRDFVEWTSTFEEEVAADAVAAWDARHARDEVSRPMEPAAGASRHTGRRGSNDEVLRQMNKG